MTHATFWLQDRFPVVYEGGKAKAVLVDITSFNQMELILENLLNREEEPEDAILAASTTLLKMLTRAKQEQPESDWEQALNGTV
jgi:hypothetical protein